MTTDDSPRRSSYRKRLPALLGAVLLSTTLALAALGSTAGAASAAATVADSYISSNSGGANMRTCADTRCGSVAYLGNGTAVYMLCWVDAQVVQPPNSNYTSGRWFYVGLHYDNRAGYVHSSLVTNQQSVKHCG